MVPTSKISSGITNHEKMLKRQRQQKLNSKINELLEFENQFGKKDILNRENLQNKIGTVKIFTGSIFPESQYKTIMINIYDNVRSVIKEVLSKLPIPKTDLKDTDFFLTMLISSKKDSKKLVKQNKSEYRILDDDYPLYLQNKLNTDESMVTFHLKRYINSQESTMSIIKNPKTQKNEKKYFAILYPLESPDLKQPSDHPGSISLNRELIVFGSDSYQMKKMELYGHKPNNLYVLKGKSIHPVHCIISSLNGILAITPSNVEADVRINGSPIYETTILNDGMQISLGCSYFFQTHIPTKASANTSQIYWKAYQASPNKSKKSETEAFKIMDKKHLEVLLPMYVKFDPSFFEIIIEKTLNLLLNNQEGFKPAPSYILYLIFITQYDNRLSSEESPIKTTNINKEFRSFCKVCYKTLQKANMLRTCSLELNLLWLTNISEFMNFSCQDAYLVPFTEDIQMFCQHTIRITMNEITNKFENDFCDLIPAFFNPVNETDELLTKINNLINFDPSSDNEKLSNNASKEKVSYSIFKTNEPSHEDISDILLFLNRWMSLFSKYTINPSYVVQIFERFFNSIAKNLIDRIVIYNFPTHKSHDLIDSCKININILQMWAESQGLEVIYAKSFSYLNRLLNFFEADFSTMENFMNSIKKIDFFNSKQLELVLSNLHKFVGTVKSLNPTFRSLQEQAKSQAIKQIRDQEKKDNVDTPSLKVEFQMPIIKLLYVTNDGYTSENPQDISSTLFKILKTIDIPSIHFNLQDIKILRAQDNHTNWNCRFKGLNKFII